MSAANIGIELARRDHNVSALVSDAFTSRITDPMYRDLNFYTFEMGMKTEEVWNRFDEMARLSCSGRTPLENSIYTFAFVGEYLNRDCAAILDMNAKLIADLVDANFDLVMIDPLFVCSAILAEHIAEKHVAFVSTAWFTTIDMFLRLPINVAFQPMSISGFDQRMTFVQRVQNTLMFLIWKLVNTGVYQYTSIMHSRGFNINTIPLVRSSQSSVVASLM